MFSNNSDKNWESYGKSDPYYGVLTHPDYKSSNLTEEKIKAFFESGEIHIDYIISRIKSKIDRDFCPISCLDFGCGTGRLVIPLAKRFNYVTGVDVSSSMLSETYKNCQNYGLCNVDLLKSDDALSEITGTFNFIHSFIVLQHIPKVRGEKILHRLIELLSPNGVAALHFTYSVPHLNRTKTFIRTSIPFVNGLANVLKGKSFNTPVMLMTEYNLNYIINTLHEKNCNSCYIDFVKHADFSGVIIFFRKNT